MTRETKVGAVVAISFLSLVGVVVVSKWRNPPQAPEVTQSVSPEEPGAQAKADSEKSNGEQPPLPKKRPIQPAHYEGDPSEAPTKLPVDIAGSPSLVAPAPPVTLPPLPGAPGDDRLQNLAKEIEKQSQASSLPLPPPLPVNDVLNSAAAKADQLKGNAADKLDKGLPGLDQGLDSFFNRNKDAVASASEKLKKQVNDPVNKGLGQLDEGVNKAATTANNQLEDMLKKGSEATSKGLDNLNNVVSPPLPAPANNSLPANNALPVPPMVAAPEPLPPLPGGPGEKPGPNNLPAPPPTAPSPPGLAPLPAPANAATKTDTPPPPIPAPQVNLPTIATNLAPMPAIPAPRPEVRVVDAKSYTASAGDTFATISKNLYGTDRYAKALLAYNREFSPNRNSLTTILQAGQTVVVPPEQMLKERYSPFIDDAPAASLNTPAPIPMPRPATADPTKQYRVPAQGQFLFEIAIRTMGDGNRWTEIYRLNPNINPQQPIPGGTELRLPATARVQ